jgi:hypothetical protein
LIYNNKQNKKEITLPLSNSHYLYNFYYSQGNTEFRQLSDSLINKDTLFEIIYVENRYFNNMENYLTKITNDTGKIYKTIDSTKYFNISQIKGLAPKLLTKTGNDNPYNTIVWGLGGATTAVKEAPSVFDIKIYPNPSEHEMTVELLGNAAELEYKFTVFNMLGQVVFSSNIDISKQVVLKKEQIGKGFFIVKISYGQNSVTKKILFE